ncbi:helix-turn-helix domain-containing protein [Nocardia jiangsuensis]|uniref:Helix-turn-helix domain-containing protein n=1 Tax=Nocardia jiangsuensis TaxID=1691563 RepID=A0ABV8E0E0_9NOCA
MAIIYHSGSLPRRDREDAAKTAILAAAWPTTIELEDGADPDSVLEAAGLGTASVFRSDLVGMHVSRNAKQIRTGPAETLGICVQERGIGRHEQFGMQHVLRPGELMLNYLDAPYDFSWNGRGSSQALLVPIDEIGLPRHVVAAAGSRLRASPVHDLLGSHIRHLTAAGDALAAGPEAPAVGAAAIDLVRALLASAYDPEYGRATVAELLLPRIRGYVRQHLSDHDLAPESIARAHDISVRRLFELCRAAGFSLEQWIITERLEGCHRELARPETAAVPIETIARRWGFGNPSYFGRRFRAHYGMTPRAWRELARMEAAERG